MDLPELVKFAAQMKATGLWLEVDEPIVLAIGEKSHRLAVRRPTAADFEAQVIRRLDAFARERVRTSGHCEWRFDIDGVGEVVAEIAQRTAKLTLPARTETLAPAPPSPAAPSPLEATLHATGSVASRKPRAIPVMDSSILKRPFAVVAFFAVIGMGYFHLNRGIDEIQTAELSESWPSVTGIVVASSVTSTGGGEDGRHAEYFANVRYRYSVGGLAHEASRVSFGVPHRGSGFAYSVVERYPKGKSVTVFYDAVRPSEARLEPAPLLSGSYMAIVFGGLLILIPGAIGFLYIWQWTEDLWKRLRAPVR